MSSMSAGSTPERDTAPPTAISARRNASTSTSEPLRARPMGVRAAATMTASVTGGSSSARSGWRAIVTPRSAADPSRLRRRQPLQFPVGVGPGLHGEARDDPVEPAREPPVAVAEQLHGRRYEH